MPCIPFASDTTNIKLADWQYWNIPNSSPKISPHNSWAASQMLHFFNVVNLRSPCGHYLLCTHEAGSFFFKSRQCHAIDTDAMQPYFIL